MVKLSASPVRVRELKKTYRSGFAGRKKLQALCGVSVEVERGQVFGLLGPNGAGKTTMIKVLLGLIGRFEGEALLFGEPIGPAKLRRRVGYLPEAHLLPPYLTGRQVLDLFGQLSGVPHSELRDSIPRWLERVGIEQAADRKLKEYSKGMKQRLGLAQAFIHGPELVFLDEPTDGVDPVGRKEIREIISDESKRGATVFINSHLLMEVQKVCDSVVILNRGLVQRSGSTEELAASTASVRLRLVVPSPADPRTDPAALLAGLGQNLREQAGAWILEIEDEELQVAIDRLRAAGVMIRGIERQRLSLEDAFIESVEAGQAQ